MAFKMNWQALSDFPGGKTVFLGSEKTSPSSNSQFGLLTGGAVGICGASAALAIAAILPAHERKERALIFTIIDRTAVISDTIFRQSRSRRLDPGKG